MASVTPVAEYEFGPVTVIVCPLIGLPLIITDARIEPVGMESVTEVTAPTATLRPPCAAELPAAVAVTVYPPPTGTLANVYTPLALVVPVTEYDPDPVSVSEMPGMPSVPASTVTLTEPTGMSSVTFVVEPPLTETPVCCAVPAPSLALTV